MIIDRRRINGVYRKKTISPYSKEELKRIEKESKEKRKKIFQDLGIKNKKALQYFVEAAGITPESFVKKLNDFKNAGFKDPLALFNKFPVSYNFEPRRVISFLQKKFSGSRYFNFSLTEADVIKIIEHFPECITEGNLLEKQVKKALKFLAKKTDEANVKKDENR